MIGAEAEAELDWLGLVRAFEDGFSRPRASVGDTFLNRGSDVMLTRSAWIEGLGIAVKTATLFPANAAAGKPVIGGGVSVYSDADGALEAILDFALVTKWKTAGDSLFGARKLARPDSRRILIVGAGVVGRSLRQAYGALFPGARFAVWNRTPEKAIALADAHPDTVAAPDLEAAVGEADIVASATMSSTPVLKGAWFRPGQHIDLIGAYKADMREVDDEALRRATIHVDSRDTTFHHIGELKIPLEAGTITEEDVVSDHYDGDAMRRRADGEITLFKNGGGAHMDLMTCRYIMEAAMGDRDSA